MIDSSWGGDCKEHRVRIEDVLASGYFRAVYGRGLYRVACCADRRTDGPNVITLFVMGALAFFTCIMTYLFSMFGEYCGVASWTVRKEENT